MAITNLGAVGISAGGAYNPETVYKKYKVVSANGGSYMYINPMPAAGVPVTDTSHWQQIATVGGQDLVDAAVAARDAAQGYKDAAANSAAQLQAGIGSPAGAYDDLAALNTANPAHDRTYLTKNDWKLAYYDEIAQAFVAGGVYQAASISAEFSNLAYKSSGYPVTCTLANGSAPNTGNTQLVHTSNYIKVSHLQTAEINVSKVLGAPTNYYTFGYALYDANKTVIPNPVNIDAYTPHLSVVSIPEGAHYIRFTIGEYTSSRELVTRRATDYAGSIVMVWVRDQDALFYSKAGSDATSKANAGYGSVWGKYNNLFDGYTREGYLDATTGEFVPSESFLCTEHIPCMKHKYYYDIYAGYQGLGSPFTNIVFYDQNNVKIARYSFGKDPLTPSPTNTTGSALVFRAPADGYFAMTCNKSGYNADLACIIESDVPILTMGDMPAYTPNYNVNHRILREWMSGVDANLSQQAPSIITRNADIRNVVDACGVYGHHAGGVQNVGRIYTLLVTTDIHNDATRLKSAIDYLNATPPIDAGICLGDIPGSYFNDNDGVWYATTVSASTKAWYTAIGNHDAGNAIDTVRGATKAQQFAKWIQPTIAKIGIPELTKTYYSVNTAYGVTLIVLDFHDLPDTMDAGEENFLVSRTKAGFSQDQIDWFISTLNSVPAGNHVVIAIHALGEEPTKVTANWSETHRSISGAVDYDYPGIIPDIVNAWQNGATLSETYVPAVTAAQPTLTVSADFSGRGVGVFACYLHGHYHQDQISSVVDYPTQKCVSLSSTASDTNQNYASDLPRTLGTKSEDCITVFSVDKPKRRIKLVRVGSNVTFDFVNRTTYILDY